jgi:hypothetical protein
VNEDPETPADTEPGPEPEPDDDEANERLPTVGRCEAETTVGGTLYRCALEEGHEDDHSFQPLQEAAPAQDDSEKLMLKSMKSLEREAERHANRIREIVGPDANDLLMCPLCPPNFGGWRFDVAPSEDATRATRIAIGLPDMSNYAMSATERPCDDCRGLGKVRTGSVVPGRETTTCDACGGKGYVATRPRLNTSEDTAPAPAPVNGDAAHVEDGIKRDMFGTPEGDPDYNLMPAARARPIEYWQAQRAG